MKEILLPETNDFLDHFFGPAPDASVVDEILENLRRKGFLIAHPDADFCSTSSQETLSEDTSDYSRSSSPSNSTAEEHLSPPVPHARPSPSSDSESSEDESSEDDETRSATGNVDAICLYEALYDSVCMSLMGAAKQVNNFSLVMASDAERDINADGITYLLADMNRNRFVSIAARILRGDASRNSVLGITEELEGQRISLWHFSHNRTVKATSFSYAKRPDLLVRVFVSLLSASGEDMGYESHITHLADGSYLYELDECPEQGSVSCSLEENSKRQQSYFFKTTHLLSGGHTRIWKAVEVTSKDDPSPKDSETREIVLKDTWICADSMTEFEIQQHAFRDIEALQQTGWESLPILKDIPPDRDEFGQLRTYLTDGAYKTLFLRYDERMRYTGPPTKPIHLEQFGKPFYNYASIPTSGEYLGSTVERRTTQREPFDPSSISNIPRVSSNKRCFFVFPETCTRVSNLPTLGDVMDVLKQGYFALLIMFCAGWVHRDISDGNILAIEKNGKWEVRLADLEFAKKLSPNLQESSDLRVGTPYFMATEIQSSMLICPLDHRKLEKPKSAVWGPPPPDRESAPTEFSFKTVVHTVLHDIESLWWLILWIITSRVSCEASKIAMKAIFRVTNAPSAARTNLLKGFMPNWVQKSGLHDRVKRIGFELDEFREHLYANYFQNTPKMRLDRSNYADICAIPPIFFQNIETSREAWDSLPLQQSTTSIEPARLATPPIPLVAHDPDGVDATSYRGLSKRKFLDSGAIAAPILNQDGEGHDSGPSKKRRLRHRVLSPSAFYTGEMDTRLAA
ncbi:hypothetical protein DFP72DRAFT_1043790 [Ephemerocybe angulata]|uniref:Protein kinase domain-containing protein n=1 Tax=Ephemerocybe angulata TaxID=980116 RepID=A0A8H6I5E2_9AGAR|nr:hypothetical protein DFP72DRAFT_1043790 [Tulosesus angulatus]